MSTLWLLVEAARLDRWTQMELRQSGTVAQPTPTSTSPTPAHTHIWRGVVVVRDVKKVNSEVQGPIKKHLVSKQVAKTD